MDLSTFNFPEEEEKGVVQSQFREAFLILQQNAIVDNEPVMCELHDVVRLVRNLCAGMHKCVAVTRDNPAYRSAVESRTTFLDYWLDAEAFVEQ